MQIRMKSKDSLTAHAGSTKEKGYNPVRTRGADRF